MHSAYLHGADPRNGDVRERYLLRHDWWQERRRNIAAMAQRRSAEECYVGMCVVLCGAVWWCCVVVPRLRHMWQHETWRVLRHGEG